MPKTKTRKKVPAKKAGLSKILKLLNPNSPKKKFLVFIAAFIVIGGGVMAYKSFAADVVVGVYWPQQLTTRGGSASLEYSTEGQKKETLIWVLRAKGDSVRIQDQWQPVIWAKKVRTCANVYNPTRGVQGTVLVKTFWNNNNGPYANYYRYIQPDGAYHKVCTDYENNVANARIGAMVENVHGDSRIHVGSMSVEYLQ